MFLSFINEYMWDGASPVYKTKKQNQTQEINYVYLLKDNKVLKLLITINEFFIENLFFNLKDNLEKKDFKDASIEEVIENKYPISQQYFENSRHIFRTHNNTHRIPNKSKLNRELLYILTDMYNKESLTSDDLYNLNEEYTYRNNACNNIDKISKLWIIAIKKIINRLNIEIVDEYDYDTFSTSLDFLETITVKEKLYSEIDLKNLKNILLTAQGNQDVFKSLNINVKHEEELELRK